MFTGKSNIPEERLYPVRFLGTGAADPTKQAGPGVTVTRTAAGVYKLTFAKNPGTLVGIRGHAFGADAPAAVKGYTLTRGPLVTTGGVYSVEVSVWNSLFAAADLAAAQYLDVTFAFAAQSVIT